MPTVQQLIRKPRAKGGKKAMKAQNAKALRGNPQRRGVCTRVYTTNTEKAELRAA